ncbi:methionyl-tRNA synthetase [Gloeomargarita lithophora Alchichica-D10]|uniref:Methionine--tRNA ligase n=1 Tax=Gloeomargarita lithophora Alchichica-D10 TaxID=1188229 RepID=A0A1J0AAP6_9CYAN|nr:methionine--tRNA ligase [Gloeomargarita lithophora]APB33002.1 methionyl-tRNA synthetase [Gloeomargarita lithophora Alchichica-D10]
MARFSLTTPLYYVNARPHIGSAYTTMAADALARFARLRGNEVLLVTGTDEHGQKIQRTAQERGVPPQQHCDQMAGEFETLWQMLNIRWQSFIRTTDFKHEPIVQEFFQRLWDKGDIYLHQQQGWYCVACEEFKDERELLPEKHCPLHPNLPVEWRDEPNYFFRLSRYQAQLEDLYQTQPDFIQPSARRNEVLKFVAQGLADFSISRLHLDWGFPVPVDPNQVIYVWFDALLGYLTALVEPGVKPSLEAAVQTWWPVDLHLIGKDILRFHAVYWPALLMAAELPLPKRIFAHGFLTKDGQKMSKSLGNIIDPFALVAEYGSDALRYYFLKEIELGKDGDFNEERFIQTVNADLANDLGNLLNRTLKLVHKYCGGKVPSANVSQDDPLALLGQNLATQIAQAYEQLALHRACGLPLALAQRANKWMDEQAPWQLAKTGAQGHLEGVLYRLLEAVRLAAYLLSPVIPQTSTRIYQQLGYGIDFDGEPQLAYDQQSQWGALPPGQLVAQPEPVFARIGVPKVIKL